MEISRTVSLEQHWFAFTKHRKPGKGLLWLVMAEGQISREREWEVKNEEQNMSMRAAERELTALFRALRHFNLCSKFGLIFLSVCFGLMCLFLPVVLMNFISKSV